MINALCCSTRLLISIGYGEGQDYLPRFCVPLSARSTCLVLVESSSDRVGGVVSNMLRMFVARILDISLGVVYKNWSEAQVSMSVNTVEKI